MDEFKMSNEAYRAISIFISYLWARGNAISNNVSDMIVDEAERQIYIDNEV